jgi:hypothetical protein
VRWRKQREQAGILFSQASGKNPGKEGAERLHLGRKRFWVVAANHVKPPVE